MQLTLQDFKSNYSLPEHCCCYFNALANQKRFGPQHSKDTTGIACRRPDFKSRWVGSYGELAESKSVKITGLRCSQLFIGYNFDYPTLSRQLLYKLFSLRTCAN